MRKLLKAGFVLLLILAVAVPIAAAKGARPNTPEAIAVAQEQAKADRIAQAERLAGKPDRTVDVRNILTDHPVQSLEAPLRLLRETTGKEDRKFVTGKIAAEYLSMFVGELALTLTELLPDRRWPTFDNYKQENLFRGTETFADAPTAEKWQVGFASASVIPDDVADGGYVLAGYFNNKKCTGVTEDDDQRINAVAMDAGSGTMFMCSLDGFGLTGTDIRTLRGMLNDFAKEKGILGINLSCTHTHYCLDIHGTGTNVGQLFKDNFALVPKGMTKELQSKNQKLMDHLFAVCKQTILEAYSNLEPGKITYGKADIYDLMWDKQQPQIFDKYVHRFRFVPDREGAMETWLVNMAVHPTTMNGDTTTVSADYPGKIAKIAREKENANVAFFQGAEAAVSRQMQDLPITGETTDIERITIYGQEIINRMKTITNEAEVKPLLNFRAQEVYLKIDNPLMKLMLRLQLANNAAISGTGRLDDTYIISEIGYCELGLEHAILFVPGEISPEIIYGGTRPAEQSWNDATWNYPALVSLAGGREVLAMGLMNDQFGYIMPDNDHGATFSDMINDSLFEFLKEGDSHYEELLSVGPQTASTMTEAYMALLESVRPIDRANVNYPKNVQPAN